MESDTCTTLDTLKRPKEAEHPTRPLSSGCPTAAGPGTKHMAIPVPIPTIEAIKLNSTLPRAKSDKLMSVAPPRLPKPYQKMALCGMCGQFHDDVSSHLYDYPGPVDEDLVCHICLQPLVHPLDTKCGHTFCGRCIENHLDVQKLCPIDRLALHVRELTPSSLVIRK